MVTLGTHAGSIMGNAKKPVYDSDGYEITPKDVESDEYKNESLLRHFILNSIRSYNSKYKDKYGELVIACDDKDYWRKDIFPYYKAHRKKDRDSSDLDWGKLFNSLNKIRDEIKETFGFRVIQVARAEADDVIATLCDMYGNTHEKILIISGDKDFRQLQSYMNVEQYDPTRKRWLKENNPSRYLKEHIMRGDAGDGVPGFLDPDDKFVNNIKAKQLRQKKLDVWLDQSPEEFCNEQMLRGYKRNEALVDLSFIPEKITQQVKESFSAQAGKRSKDMLGYFIKHKLKNLTDVITEFKVKV